MIRISPVARGIGLGGRAVHMVRLLFDNPMYEPIIIISAVVGVLAALLR
jgi:hypothetical protein